MSASFWCQLPKTSKGIGWSLRSWRNSNTRARCGTSWCGEPQSPNQTRNFLFSNRTADTMSKYQNIHQSYKPQLELSICPLLQHRFGIIFSSAIRMLAPARASCFLRNCSASEAAGIAVGVKRGDNTPHSCSCKAARPELFCFTLHTDLEANIFPTTSPNRKHFEKSEGFTEYCFGKTSSRGLSVTEATPSV